MQTPAWISKQADWKDSAKEQCKQVIALFHAQRTTFLLKYLKKSREWSTASLQHLPGWPQTDKSELPRLLLQRRSVLKYSTALQAVVYLAFVRNVDGNSIQYKFFSLETSEDLCLGEYSPISSRVVLGNFWQGLKVFLTPWSTSHPVTTLLVPLPNPRPLFRSLPTPRSALFPGGWHNFHQQAQCCQGLWAELTSPLKHAKAATKSLLSFLRCSCKNPCLSTAKSKVCYLLENYGVGGRT